jgi:hypothetical protein
MEAEKRSGPADTDKTEKIAMAAIEKARMVLPGIQALFQLIAAFQERRLGRAERRARNNKIVRKIKTKIWDRRSTYGYCASGCCSSYCYSNYCYSSCCYSSDCYSSLGGRK